MIFLDSFIQGEHPEPLEYTYTDADGDPVDLSGFDVVFQFRVGNGEAVEVPAELADADTGTVMYQWDPADLDGWGLLRALFFVDDGTNGPWASEPIRGYVRPALYTAAS
jgi:hypothetical protein